MGISRHLTVAATVTRLRCNEICNSSRTIQNSIRYCACSVPNNQAVISRYETKRYYSTGKSDESSQRTGTEIDIARESPYAGLSFGEKVKEVGKDVSYTGFIIVGVGILGTIVYVIMKELFSGDSPNGIYDRALKRCIHDPELSAALGEPIKGYGETSRRGRRRHVSHTEYIMDNQKRMRMQFYVEGQDKKGTVQLEMMKNDSGKYDYRFLLVQLNEYPYRTFILEDNR